MAVREGIRCGGRSARIQAEVHKAVKEMQAEAGRDEITVPAIAARAGVTPSTIYRRWGTLAELLADVAVERLRPIADPADTGSTQGDVEAWIEQYVDETASDVGKALLRDIFANAAGTNNPIQCCNFTRETLEVIRDRGVARGEAPLDIDEILDIVIAPIMYRILFQNTPPTAEECRKLLARVRSLPSLDTQMKSASLSA